MLGFVYDVGIKFGRVKKHGLVGGWVKIGLGQFFFFSFTRPNMLNLAECEDDGACTISLLPWSYTWFWSDPAKSCSYVGMGSEKLHKRIKSYAFMCWSAILTTMVIMALSKVFLLGMKLLWSGPNFTQAMPYFVDKHFANDFIGYIA